MSLRNIIDATLSIAQSVANAGKVYKHLVWSVEDADIASLFQDGDGRVNTIMITRESTPSLDRGPNDNRDRHLIVLDWYRGVHRVSDDSQNTEDAFQNDVEAMRSAFKGNRKLTINSQHNAIWCDPMQADRVEYVMFKNILCHHARLSFVAEDGPFNTTSV